MGDRPQLGKALATGLARIDGYPVAVLASDPYHYGGAFDRATTEKYIRMIDLAELFHLPVVNFVDVPASTSASRPRRKA